MSPLLRRLAIALALWALPFSATAADQIVPPLNSPATGLNMPGKFIWADLVASDPAVVIKFYTELFGWTAQPISGEVDYTILLNNGRPVAGVIRRNVDPKSKSPGGARWIGSIAVKDMEAAMAKVIAGGGRVVIAPRQIPDRGLQAVVADAEGALLGLLTSSSGDPSDHDPQYYGWIWVQLFSKDPAKASAFYGQALGYTITDDARTASPDDYLLSSGGKPRAGMTPLPAGSDGRPGWLGYVLVPEMSADLKAAEDLGAKVLFAPPAQSGAPQVAIIADPLGGAIGLVTLPAETTKEESK